MTIKAVVAGAPPSATGSAVTDQDVVRLGAVAPQQRSDHLPTAYRHQQADGHDYHPSKLFLGFCIQQAIGRTGNQFGRLVHGESLDLELVDVRREKRAHVRRQCRTQGARKPPGIKSIGCKWPSRGQRGIGQL